MIHTKKHQSAYEKKKNHDLQCDNFSVEQQCQLKCFIIIKMSMTTTLLKHIYRKKGKTNNTIIIRRECIVSVRKSQLKARNFHFMVQKMDAIIVSLTEFTSSFQCLL